MLNAFSATDGTLRWRYDHQLAIPSLVVGNRMVYQRSRRCACRGDF
jgi:hypothetical protein